MAFRIRCWYGVCVGYRFGGWLGLRIWDRGYGDSEMGIGLVMERKVGWFWMRGEERMGMGMGFGLGWDREWGWG